MRRQIYIGAAVHHNDTVAVTNGGKTVRNNDTGTFQRIRRLRYLLLRDVVRRAGDLVKNENPP